MADYQAAEDQRVGVRAQYDKLASTDMLSDPIGYVFAQLQLPSVAAQNNALASAKESALQDIGDRYTLMQQAKQNTTINTADKLKEIRLAEAANARQAAEVQLQQASAEMDSKLAAQHFQTFQLRDKVYDVNDSLFNKTLQVQQWQMSYESLQLQRQAANEARKEREKVKKDEADNLLQLNAGLGTLSKFIGSSIPLNVDIIKQMKDNKKKQLMVDAAVSGSLGSTMSEGIELIDSVGNREVLARTNPGFYKTVQGIEAGIRQAEAKLLSSPAGAALRTKPVELRKLAEAEYRGTMITQATNLASTNTLSSPAYDKVFSPYKAQHKVMLQDPTLENNAYAKALKLVAETNVDRVSREANIPADLEQIALGSVIAQVSKGTLGPEAAATAIAEYHQKAAKANFDMFQYGALGLPAQSKAVITLPAGSYWGSPANVDAMDVNQLKAVIVKNVAQSKTPQMSTMMPTPMMLAPIMAGELVKQQMRK
jgi:hypothetical protein